MRTLHQLEAEARPATPHEQATLARWSGWGAVPAVWDEGSKQHAEWAWARAEAAELLNADELAAAARNTLNAHYTDASLVKEIWRAVQELGFSQGRVLEPGVGTGNFIGVGPDGAEVVGVELEPITAGIAARLYPQARILTESFAETRAPEGSFDVAIGNVPFADAKLHDRRHNRGNHSIHNHFIIKSLALTKPGGLVAVLTSAYTLDATPPGARREMAAMADLIGAIRLPNGAHRRAAGTDALTDVLILRRRENGRDPDDTAWERTQPIEIDGVSLRVNEYFLAHPEHVLGEFVTGDGLYRSDELSVRGDRNAAPALAAAVDQVVARAKQRGLIYSDAALAVAGRPAALVGQAANRPDGYLHADPDGTFTQVVDGAAQPYQPPASQAAELRALLRLRDTEVALLEAEAANLDDTDYISELRAQLNRGYDSYVRQHGPINRFTERRTGRVDPESGADIMARIRPPQGGFRSDPFSNVVYALEHFDSRSQTATKADIFVQRVVAPRAPRLGADTPADALAICLDTHGEVRLDVVAHLLGVDEDAARAGLDTLVFDEPGTGRLVSAPEYLSGQVRVKLTQAQAAAAEDPRFAVNVTALAEVVPADLTADQIQARLGASWIDKRYVRQFLQEILEDPSIRVEHPGGSMWTVKSERRRTVAATSQWGTERCPAPDIAQALLEQRQIRITDEDTDGKRHFNAEATLAAQAKAEEMVERFGEWVWEDPERAADLVRTYNDKFNGLVLRSYDNVPLSLPGLAVSFKPRPHQVAAVARVIAEPSVGLWHEVGAGKTAEMAMAAMELRRLGLVKKPTIVVPNHMLAQFSSEFLKLYPKAKILAASTEDLTRDKRRQFQARCATGDWDAVIMTRSAFERTPMSPEVQKAYLKREIASLEAAILRAQEADERLSLKRLEAMKLRTEERLKAKLDGAKDPGITFEKTGVDYVLVDEAHGYKNLRTASNIANMSVDGSQRATDLDMKLGWLRERYDRVATLATATPIANSMGETYTMLRYLRPDLLDELGITDFDSFAATFGELVTAIEVAPDGGMRMNTRFAKFVNVPELLRPWNIAGDVKTAEDLNLPTPAQAPRPSDGERAPETVVVPPSEELKAFIGELSDRADKVRNRAVHPSEDNLLKISSEGRAAALDLRLVGRQSSEAGKVDVAAEHIAAIHAQHADTVYPGPDGQPHPIPGALQIVFADLGTPSPDRWNVYDELRGQLVSRGVPREKIRFMHEARNDKEKGELFAACRDGRVAVLIGSTERMGVGTNVQARAVALHHMDCPWRPADLQQREGRILRQGNHNPEVRILRYVTEGSFDAYSWQTVTRKAQFIAQVMRGKLDVREIEDIGDNALSYNEVKALATGNPLLLDHAQAQSEVTRLERLERAHARNVDGLRWTVRSTNDGIAFLTKRIEAVDAAIARRVDTRGEAFTMAVDGHTFTKRADAGERLKAVLTAQMADRRIPAGRVHEIGALGGLTIAATVFRDSKDNPTVRVELLDVPMGELTLTPTEVAGGNLVTRLENRLAALEGIRSNAAIDIERRRGEVERASAQMDQPFRQADALIEARERLDEITRMIEESTRAQPAPAGGPTGATNTPTDEETPASANATTPGEVIDAQPPPGGRDPLLGDRPRDPDEILQIAVVIVGQHGWVSRQQAEESYGAETATATLVDRALNGTGEEATQLRTQTQALITPDVVARARNIRAWATGLAEHSDTEYARDLAEVARRDSVEPWRLPLLVSAVAGYDRDERTQAQIRATAGSQWQGTVGDRVTVNDAMVLSARPYSHAYGDGTTLRLADADGNVYTWFSSRTLDLAEGDRTGITGRIKDHTTWQDRRETQLTRCTLTPATGGNPPALTAMETTAAPTAPSEGGSPPAQPATVPAIGVEDWISGLGPEIRQGWDARGDQEWLEQQLAHLATDPKTQTMARVNALDNFTLGFERTISDHFTDLYEPGGRDDFFVAYFNRSDIREGLHAFAARAVYDAARGTAAQPMVDVIATEPAQAPAPDDRADGIDHQQPGDEANRTQPDRDVAAGTVTPAGRAVDQAAPAITSADTPPVEASAAADSTPVVPAAQAQLGSVSDVAGAGAPTDETSAVTNTPSVTGERRLQKLGSGLGSEFTGGTPYTSANRIRGPLRSVKTACNSVLRVPQWKSRQGTYEGHLAAAIDEFKALSVGESDPVELLAGAVTLAREARTLRRQRYTTGVDPVLSMVTELARMSSGLASDLVATALKPNRWTRVFGTPAPDLRWQPEPETGQAEADSTAPTENQPTPTAQADAEQADHDVDAQPTSTTADTPASPEPDMAANEDPFAPFTPAEQAMIRHATEDYAGNYYGQVGGFHFGRSDAERYVAEGHLKQLDPRHQLATLWRAVTAHLDAHPEILQADGLTDTQRTARQQQRSDQAQQLASEAYRAFRAGQPQQALILIDQGEQTAPEHRPNGVTWQQIRDRISAAATNDPAAQRPAPVDADQPAPQPNQDSSDNTTALVAVPAEAIEVGEVAAAAPTAAAEATADPATGTTWSARSYRQDRRQVTAWLAQGLSYESIAEAAQRDTLDRFASPEGREIDDDQIDTHLSDLAAKTLRGDGLQPGVYWRGVRISLHQLDDHHVEAQLTGDGKSRVRLSVPAAWITDDPGRIRATITEAITSASERAAHLIASANALAGSIPTRTGPPTQQPATPPPVGRTPDNPAATAHTVELLSRRAAYASNTAEQPPGADDQSALFTDDTSHDVRAGTAAEDTVPAEPVDQRQSELDELNRQARILEHLRDTTNAGHRGMRFHREGQQPSPVAIPQAINLFSRMIDRVEQAGAVAAHLSWNGVDIAISRDQSPDRLKVAVGAATAQVDIPLREAWPESASRAELLRKITLYIDTAGQRAVRVRQRVDDLAGACVATPTGAQQAFPASPMAGGAAGRRAAPVAAMDGAPMPGVAPGGRRR